MASASATDSAIPKKTRGEGFIRTGKKVTLVMSYEDMVDIIKMIKSLENSGILIHGISETAKHEIKKQES